MTAPPPAVDRFATSQDRRATMALTPPDRRRILLASALTLVALPALWWAEPVRHAAHRTSRPPASLSSTSRRHAPPPSPRVGDAAPVFLDGPSGQVGAGLAEIAVPAPPAIARITTTATFRSTLGVATACIDPGIGNGQRVTVVNLDNNRSITCTAVLAPSGANRPTRDGTANSSPRSPISPTRRFRSRSVSDALASGDPRTPRVGLARSPPGPRPELRRRSQHGAPHRGPRSRRPRRSRRRDRCRPRIAHARTRRHRRRASPPSRSTGASSRSCATSSSDRENVRCRGRCDAPRLVECARRRLARRSPAGCSSPTCPYNVATPLICDLLDDVPAIERMIVMVQREAAERFAAAPRTSAYGAVSVKAAYLGHGQDRRPRARVGVRPPPQRRVGAGRDHPPRATGHRLRPHCSRSCAPASGNAARCCAARSPASSRPRRSRRPASARPHARRNSTSTPGVASPTPTSPPRPRPPRLTAPTDDGMRANVAAMGAADARPVSLRAHAKLTRIAADHRSPPRRLPPDRRRNGQPRPPRHPRRSTPPDRARRRRAPSASGMPLDDSNLVARALQLAGRHGARHDRQADPPRRRPRRRLDRRCDRAALGRIRHRPPTTSPPPSALGADIPFCLVGGRARVTGIGEIVEPLPHLDIIVTLVIPPLAVSTPAAYRAWDAARRADRLGPQRSRSRRARRRTTTRPVARPDRRTNGHGADRSPAAVRPGSSRANMATPSPIWSTRAQRWSWHEPCRWTWPPDAPDEPPRSGSRPDARWSSGQLGG